MEKHILSKSTFIKGLQCEKALYLSKHHRELKDELSVLNDDILTCHSKLLLSDKLKEKAEESIAKLKDLAQQYKFYQYYLEAVNRDGIPYDLITSAASIPLIGPLSMMYIKIISGFSEPANSIGFSPVAEAPTTL